MAARFSGLLAGLVGAWLVVSFPAAAQETALQKASRLEQAGDKTGALVSYKAAVSDLAFSPELTQAFDGFFRLEADLSTTVSVCRMFLAKCQSQPIPASLSPRIAGLLELAGFDDEALAVYRRDAADNGSADSLDSAIRLCLEMNDVATATDLLKGQSGADALLLGLLALQKGDAAAARESFAAAGKDSRPEVQLQGLYGLTVAAEGSAEAAAAAAQLKRAFPLSPEAQSSGGGRVLLAATPARLLPAEPPGDSGAAVAPSQAQPEPRVAVQVGSYLVKGNADDMVAELKKRGFTPTTREETVSGKLFYRVLAASSLKPEEASEVVSRLAVQGFGGVIVADK